VWQGTLVHLSEGRVLAAWFGGTYEGLEDTAIYTSLRFSRGNWSEPRVAAKVWIEPRHTLAWPRPHAHSAMAVPEGTVPFRDRRGHTAGTDAAATHTLGLLRAYGGFGRWVGTSRRAVQRETHQ
jgi:hypothetical protein